MRTAVLLAIYLMGGAHYWDLRVSAPTARRVGETLSWPVLAVIDAAKVSAVLREDSLTITEPVSTEGPQCRMT